jgi:hypothetical protein
MYICTLASVAVLVSHPMRPREDGNVDVFKFTVEAWPGERPVQNCGTPNLDLRLRQDCAEIRSESRITLKIRKVLFQTATSD